MVKPDDIEGFQTAFETPYTPTTSGDWNGPPTEVRGGLDELAGRVENIEGSLPVKLPMNFFVNTQSTTSNAVPTFGAISIITEILPGSINSVKYETSVDDGVTWIERADITALQTFFLGTAGVFVYTRAKAPNFVGGSEGEYPFIVKYTEI